MLLLTVLIAVVVVVLIVVVVVVVVVVLVVDVFFYVVLTHLSLASLLWDIGKQNSPRWDVTERGVPSGAILFA